MYCERRGCPQPIPEGADFHSPDGEKKYCSEKCRDKVAAEAKAEADRLARDARRDAVSEETGKYLAPNADVGNVRIGDGLSRHLKNDNPEVVADRKARREVKRLKRAKDLAEWEKSRPKKPQKGDTKHKKKGGGKGGGEKNKSGSNKKSKDEKKAIQAAAAQAAALTPNPEPAQAPAEQEKR